MPLSLLSKPEIAEDFLYLWRAFSELDMSRQNGFQAGYIPLTEIAVYCELWGITGDQREILLTVVRRLDIFYLNLTKETPSPKT